MKKIYILSGLVFIAIFAIADILNEDGKAGRTGSPNEFDCTGCHTSFAVNTGPGSIIISSPTLAPNWEYIPGQVYQIDVTVAQVGFPLFGFGFEALRSNNTNGGTLSVFPGSTETQLKSVQISGSNRMNVVHKQNGGLTNDSHTFSFNWTAPATNIGNVTFYTAGNATDNQGDSLGDYVYKTLQLVTPLTTGIHSTLVNEIVNVFPNPVQDDINFNLPVSSSICELQLFNINGNLILSESIKRNMAAFAPIHIQLPDAINNGIYFLKVITDNNKYFVSKVVVVN